MTTTQALPSEHLVIAGGRMNDDSERRLDALAADIAALPRPLLVALDLDGTLAPIVEDPARALVPPETARALRHLRTADGVSVALVTGRDAEQLERMIALPGVYRIVEHGRRILRPGEIVTATHADAALRKKLAHFRTWARTSAEPRGARVEEKEGSVAVHVRELAGRDANAAAIVLEEARAAAEREGLFAREGRAVLEAQSEPTDKGSALSTVIAKSGAASCVYAGDDLTDEPAIRVASEHGVGIFVRSEERSIVPDGTKAVVDGPGELLRLIKLLDARLHV